MLQLGPVNALYPSLTCIVGAHVDGKPNFITIAHVGIMNHGQPQYLSFGLHKGHYTNAGIRENKTFSVCIPSEAQVVETDYVGIVSGKRTDKSGVFEVFYGKTPAAPLITKCPVNMELTLHSVVELGEHDVFIGKIEETWADPAVLTPDNKIDIAKVRPLLFDMASLKYWALGEPVAGCWNVGKQLKKERQE